MRIPKTIKKICSFSNRLYVCTCHYKTNYSAVKLAAKTQRHYRQPIRCTGEKQCMLSHSFFHSLTHSFSR